MSKKQTVPTTPWWKNKKIIIRIVVLAVLVGIVFIVFITAAYTFHWSWTGLPSSHETTTTTEVTQPSNTQKVTTTIENQPAKTLWDWLPLLIQLLGALAIPIVVGFGTAFFTRQQAKTSEANAANQQQEELLRTYFDKISDLLLDEELSTNPKIQSIVRARTLAALRILNSERKAIVLRFLHDSDLLQYVKSFFYSLDLSNTDLSSIDLSEANLIGANLSGADLFSADLGDASLDNADLSYASLYNASLNNASLIDANLFSANLSRTYLINADLVYASLINTNLSEANLQGARITPKQLEEARNITPEQLAQIKPSKPATPQQAKTAQTSTIPAQPEIKPNQTSQEEAEQQEHKKPK